MDKNQLIEMYEKIRSAALRLSNTVKGQHSFGQVVLAQKGILEWARSCERLLFCTPVPKPLQTGTAQASREIDLSDELKNILTLMALSVVEGEGHANVNGI